MRDAPARADRVFLDSCRAGSQWSSSPTKVSKKCQVLRAIRRSSARSSSRSGGNRPPACGRLTQKATTGADEPGQQAPARPPAGPSGWTRATSKPIPTAQRRVKAYIVREEVGQAGARGDVRWPPPSPTPGAAACDTNIRCKVRTDRVGQSADAPGRPGTRSRARTCPAVGGQVVARSPRTARDRSAHAPPHEVPPRATVERSARPATSQGKRRSRARENRAGRSSPGRARRHRGSAAPGSASGCRTLFQRPRSGRGFRFEGLLAVGTCPIPARGEAASRPRDPSVLA